MTEEHDFGIYILSYPGDFHLALSLIGSLRYFHPDIPIMIIPGEGLIPDDHPFDVPVMEKPGGFWGELGYIDRKFWSFQGPFRKFLYIDADIICTRSFAQLLRRIDEQSGRFVFANLYYENQEWSGPIQNPHHHQHEHHVQWVSRALGSVERILEFDPDYDPFRRCPFNAGIFASSRTTFSEADFEDVVRREAEFYRTHLRKNFSWKTVDVFYRDQGRLNYLVEKLDIPLLNLRPDGHDIWGGHARSIEIDDVLANRAEYSFIHWAGVPRPSPSVFSAPLLFPLLTHTLGTTYVEEGYRNLREIPGYSVWRYFQPSDSIAMSLRSRVQFSYNDFKKIVRQQLSRST